MQQHATAEDAPWFESGNPAPDSGDNLRPVRSATRQPRAPSDDDGIAPPPSPDDLDMRNLFRSSVKEITTAKAERKTVNERIAAAITDLESRGMPREVTKLVVRIQNWDEPKREAFDMAYQSARAYADLPLQADLFGNV